MDVRSGFTYLLLLCNIKGSFSAQVYDAYFGEPLSQNGNRQAYLTATNATGQCTVIIEDCRKGEGRRVDGSCTNPKFPSRGSTLTPLPRLLPPMFGPGNSLRASKYGSELPLARQIRTTILADGFKPDHPFTQLASHTFVFSFVDNVDLFYVLRYGLLSDCCIGNRRNRVNPACIAMEVPDNDPYLADTGIRCLNLTRVETFQDQRCIPNSLPAERYSRVPPLLDLSPVYGNTQQRETEVRTYQGGELRVERRRSKETPPGNAGTCINNRLPIENACYQFGDSFDGNLLVGVGLNSMWFYREHNRIARELAVVNPCWDDQKLFETSRQINIAQWQYIFFYELIPNFIGRKNAISEGIIYETDGYVNDFNYKYEPGIYHEYVVGARWFHTFQDARTDLYTSGGRFRYTRRTVDDGFRTGIFEINNTESGLTNGAYRQTSAKFDDIIDIDLAEKLFGRFQRVADLPAIDIMRGRDAGFKPYNAYRKLCGMPVAKKFEDLYDTIDKEKVLALSRLYEDVDDVDLMVAIYAERMLPGAYVGPTLYCIMVNNYLLWRRSDKFFFENGNNDRRLSLPQLNEIRKTSIARVLCDSGDDISRIQPYAFIQEHEGNEIVPCDKIRGIDLLKWKDDTCYKDGDIKYNREKRNEIQPTKKIN